MSQTTVRAEDIVRALRACWDQYHADCDPDGCTHGAGDMEQVSALAILDLLREHESAEVARLESILPETFYAGRPFEDRLRQFVRAWQRAVEVNKELEEERNLLEEQADAMREALETISAKVTENWRAGVYTADQWLIDQCLTALAPSATPEGERCP